MNRLYIIGSLALLAASVLTSCSDSFLEKKKPYGQFDQSQVYGNYTAAKSRVNALYMNMMPQSNSGGGNGSSGVNDYTSVGGADAWQKSTMEYGGLSAWVDPENNLDYQSVTDYFYVINKETSPWGNIRDCNDIIENIEASSGLSQAEKDELLGQAYFFRAFRYWSMVKIYGGVCIIDHVQNPIIGDGDGSDKIVPRSSAKECIKFICDDLQKAADRLPARWENQGADFGRITSGAALALKGRVELFYASPLFNRNDKAERWETAYQTNKAALEKLQEGHFGLAFDGDAGNNGAKWASIFNNYTATDNSGICEAVLISQFNNHDFVDHYNYNHWNNWEQSIRPQNTNAVGSWQPTAEMVDLFPMSDGLKPGVSPLPYDKNLFWLNRDPRFYRTFAFPGTEWRFAADAALCSSEGLKTIFPKDKYATGDSYQLWNYTWYDTDNGGKAPSDVTTGTSNGFSPDLLNTRNAGVYIRKKSDDKALGNNPLYIFTASANTPRGFQQNAAPIIFMRYAEVLLDFAEAACGAGHYAEAVDALKKIRARVGYTEANNYGLPTDIGGDRGKLFGAILYERQIELAYEGKAFDDIRRWMLFDGGVGQSTLKSEWAVTGFGGNTCTYTGMAQLNGQSRHNIVVYTELRADEKEREELKDAEGNITYKYYDPLNDLRPTDLNGKNDWALSLTEDFTCNATGALVNPDAAGRVQAMRDFYTNYLKRKDVTADGNTTNSVILFRPEYYFIGLKKSAQETNSTLLQTIGWHDFSHGTDGTFDPLAE